MIIVSNINIAVAIKRGSRPTRLLSHAKMLLVPRKFSFFSLFLLGRLCSEVSKSLFSVDSSCRGGSRIFFRSGCTRLLLYFNTNKPHSFFFFFRIPVVLENRRLSQGECAPPAHPPP